MTTKQQTAKHTPGPWAIEYDNDTGPEDDSYWEFFRVGPATVDIARNNRDEAEANARLIAAAPALLESLRDLVEKITAAGWHEAEISEAKVAIAKATGE